MHSDIRNPICIGLFGTAGGSRWRVPFIHTYGRLGIEFFNPQVGIWDPSMAAIEAEHLASDRVVVFAVTGHTYGTGSLAELGFAMAQVKGTARRLLVYIESDLDVALTDQVARKESERARALIPAHMHKLRLPNVKAMTSLDEMLDESCRLERELSRRA